MLSPRQGPQSQGKREYGVDYFFHIVLRKTVSNLTQGGGYSKVILEKCLTGTLSGIDLFLLANIYFHWSVMLPSMKGQKT
jgi:hypothetical protein